MALIIEDGSGVENANSYCTVEDLRLYAQFRGVDITGLSDAECEVLMIKAMDYLEAQHARYKGYKSNPDQPLQWPRKDVCDVHWPGAYLKPTEIPRELEYAQFALAIEAKDHDLQPNRLPGDKGQVVREKVEGAVEVAYSNSNGASSVPAFAKPMALLAPLFKRNGLTLVRS